MSDNRAPIDDGGFSWRRLRALCLKETRQILRDPSSGLIAFVIPLMLLFIFGYGINLDSSKLHLGILMEQQSEDARDLAQAFAGSPYIEPTISDNRQQLIQQMQAGTIRGLVVIPVDFDQRMARPHDSAPIQVITDGSEPNTANFVQGYAQGVWQVWQQQRAADRGSNDKPLIDVQMRYWFNPAAISRHYIIPGAITIIMTVIGAILTSLVIAREWERGTMEALLSTQVTRSELLLSKLIPYYFLGMIAMASELLARDARTKPVIVYQHTWSNGGDCLVVKPGINTAADLKGHLVLTQGGESSCSVRPEPPDVPEPSRTRRRTRVTLPTPMTLKLGIELPYTETHDRDGLIALARACRELIASPLLGQRASLEPLIRRHAAPLQALHVGPHRGGGAGGAVRQDDLHGRQRTARQGPGLYEGTRGE